MQRHRLTPYLLIGLLTASASPALAQAPATPQLTMDQVIEKVTQAETELIERTKSLRPIMEA